MKSKLAQIFFKSVFILIPLLMVQIVFAQRVEPNRWYFKADGGVSVFFGDVKRYDYVPDHESPSEIQPMFSGSFGKEISKIFSVRGQFLYGNLSGHKKSAHYHFYSTLMGGHILTDINLYYLFTGARFGDSKLNVYTSIGAGYLMWDSELFYDTPPAEGPDLMASSKAGAFSIPGSFSLEYAFSRNFAVSGEGMLYVVTSDDVDAKPGGIKVDMFSYVNIGLTYKFRIKTKARESKIKYELDSSIYEAKLGDPQYRDPEVVVAAPEVVKDEVIEQEEAAVIAESDIVEDDVKGSDVKETVSKQKKDSNVFPINHELEKAAIQKEVWASKTYDPWPEIEFSVQILASKAPISVSDIKKDLGIAEIIVEKYDGDWYRYSAGQYSKMWKAKELRNKLRSNVGVKDAFIVVYRNNERISLAEALNYAARKQLLTDEEYIVEDKAAGKVYPMMQLVYNIPDEGVVFGVQVLSIKNNEYPLGVFAGIYGINKPILVNFKDPWYKLIISGFNSYQEAAEFQFTAREKGFIDAFVVAFKDGRRISIKRLKEELGK